MTWKLKKTKLFSLMTTSKVSLSMLTILKTNLWKLKCSFKTRFRMQLASSKTRLRISTPKSTRKLLNSFSLFKNNALCSMKISKQLLLPNKLPSSKNLRLMMQISTKMMKSSNTSLKFLETERQ